MNSLIGKAVSITTVERFQEAIVGQVLAVCGHMIRVRQDRDQSVIWVNTLQTKTILEK